MTTIQLSQQRNTPRILDPSILEVESDSTVEFHAPPHPGQRPRLSKVRLAGLGAANIPKADYEILVRKAILDHNRQDMTAINMNTGKEESFTFEQHLRILGLTEQEWEDMMNEAITDFFVNGGQVES